MTVRNHLLIGTFFGLGAVGIDLVHITALTRLQVLMFAAVVIGSVIPDIDLTLSGFKHEKFKDRTFLSHRGITHHILLPVAIAIAGFLSTGVNKAVLIAFAVGVAVHIVTDMFSPLGVPYGLKYQKRVRIPVYTTGNPSEWVFMVAVSLLILTMFFGKQII